MKNGRWGAHPATLKTVMVRHIYVRTTIAALRLESESPEFLSKVFDKKVKTKHALLVERYNCTLQGRPQEALTGSCAPQFSKWKRDHVQERDCSCMHDHQSFHYVCKHHQDLGNQERNKRAFFRNTENSYQRTFEVIHSASILLLTFVTETSILTVASPLTQGLVSVVFKSQMNYSSKDVFEMYLVTTYPSVCAILK